MKKLLLFCSIFFFGNQLMHSQTTLVAGDIAIIAYNADVTDEFSFIPLKDLAGGTVINFTDFGWTSDSNGFQLSCNVANTSGAVTDGAITWTAPPGGVLFGRQVHIVCGGTSLSASHGTVVGLQATANSVFLPPIEYMSLSPGGDHIFAFQGTLASPTLITAIGMNGPWDATLTNCEFTSSKSVFPSALNATNSMAITPEVDNAKYNCSVTSGSASVLRTAILNAANWDVNNDTPFTLPIACFGTCTDPTVPTITASTNPVCSGNTTTLNIAGTLNNATQWAIYTGSCGGTLVGTTTTSSFVVTPTGTSTTYYVRGEGGCVSLGSCGSTIVTITNPPTAGTLSGNQNICAGSTTTFSSSQSGGTWSTSNGAIATINPTTGLVNGVAAGTATMTYTVTGTGGCPNATATRTVNVTPSSNNTTTITACDSYTWANNGQTYTTSGTYTGTTTNCVTEILNLTITPSSNNTTTITACDSYTWTNNGQTYTASGTYTGTTTNCVTEILNLTITPSSNNTTTITACDSYTWTNNGQTYTTSGTYTGTTTNCVTEILNLTITPSSNNTTTITACDSYTWTNNGQTYTTSGTYTGTTTNCVTEILNLTITPSSNNTTTISACDSYTWANNGQTYTTSGTYTGTTTNCVTEILNLTIIPSSNNTTTISACDSYTWTNNGQTYITSGTYTGTTTNCVTEILNLTITPSSNNTTTITATDNYTWAVNGVMYTVSGTYTFVNGCVTEILNLTIVPGNPGPSIIPSQCGVTLDIYNRIVYATAVPGAQRYRFRVTNLGTNQVVVAENPLRHLFLRNLAIYEYVQAYEVEVAVRVNNIWSDFGTACTITTPIVTTQVRASQCGATLATKLDIVYADNVSGVIGYRFRVTNLTTNSVQIIDRSTRAFQFNAVTDYSDVTNYSVEVALMNTDGSYLPYGTACIITTPVTSGRLTVAQSFDVVGYPNPFDGGFKLDLKSSSTAVINVRVYDMIGKLIDDRQVHADEIENFEAGANYPKGVYNIIITQADNMKSVRMIKR